MTTFRGNDYSNDIIATGFGLVWRAYALFFLFIVAMFVLYAFIVWPWIPAVLGLAVAWLWWVRHNRRSQPAPRSVVPVLADERPEFGFDEDGWIVYFYYNDRGQRLDHRTNPKYLACRGPASPSHG